VFYFDNAASCPIGGFLDFQKSAIVTAMFVLVAYGERNAVHPHAVQANWLFSWK